MKKNLTFFAAFFTFAAIVASCSGKWDDNAMTVTVNADQVTSEVSPLMYGLMTEEINYSYDGGLYAELIRNRAFAAPEIYFRRPQRLSSVLSRVNPDSRASSVLPSSRYRL